jgi:hypothetical protein
MTDELERRLRDALRPVDPSVGFADRVLERLDRESVARIEARGGWPRMRALRRHWYSGVALAASVVLAVVAVNQLQHELHEREGLEARRQLIEALRVTSEKLDLAYDAVNGPPSSDDPGV